MSEFQPPIGTTFKSSYEVRAIDLCAVLRKTSVFIQARTPYIKLEKFDDWWEHDGLHFFGKHISLEDLFSLVRSPKSLLESMPGDFDVFVGIYSKDFPFYLRFYVDWDDDETELIGRFDITFPTNIAAEFRDEVVSICSVGITESNSEEYYQSIIL